MSFKSIPYRMNWFDLSMALGALLATLIGISFS